MNRERIPIKEYAGLADQFRPKRRPARQWARLAVQAGMKYMVMTTKHHEGYCLWDTVQTDYNSLARGPGRDLVAEYVDACREYGLKVGFYYSLMDWHHPDGARCVHDAKARKRFLSFTHGCVRELMSNYGRIDILWYDVPWPLETAALWQSRKMNAMVRGLQPDIIINNRSRLEEDFGTPEERILAEKPGRAWEACMTFNGSWGYMPCVPDQDWLSPRQVVLMLQQVAAMGGNLLLNIGPAPDGSVPVQAVSRLKTVGSWLEQNGQAVYGNCDLALGPGQFQPGLMSWMNTGRWTVKGKDAYYWVHRWPGRQIAIGGMRSKVLSASLLGSGRKVAFSQKGRRVVLSLLPAACPDRNVKIAVIKLACRTRPRQVLGPGCKDI